MTAAAGAGSAAAAGGGGTNPFWEVTNLFSQPNKQGLVSSLQLGAAAVPGGGNWNPGNFLRGGRLVVRPVTPGVGGTPSQNFPFNIFSNLGVQAVDGAEILYNTIDGWLYAQAHRFFRPWLQDPTLAYDFVASAIAPSFTIMLMPEVRQQLGVLENTDTRSQFAWTQTINTYAGVIAGGGTAPFISVTPYVDMWAQPDAEDLEKTANEQIPPGTNLQTKLRRQTFTLNAAGSDNNFLSTLTGNAVRAMLLIAYDSNNVRQDYLSNPIQWQFDQRNMGTLSPDIVFQWAEDFYRGYGGVTRPQGVYPFPRFYSPGNMYGQGWMYTANSSAVSFESSTLSTAANVPGTVQLLQEEVYATGPVDPTLIDL